MGWESRGNGRYFYRKRRVGGRVVSEYYGAGEWVEALAQLDGARQNDEKLQREIDQLDQEREQEHDAGIIALAGILDTLTVGALLLNGCHTHHGTWRRRRRP